MEAAYTPLYGRDVSPERVDQLIRVMRTEGRSRTEIDKPSVEVRRRPFVLGV